VAVTDALKDMKVQMADDKNIRAEVAKHFTDQAGKIKGPEQLFNEVKGVLGKLNLKIPESDKFKANEAAFDLQVAGLADDREPGFVARHHEALKRIQDIIKRIDDQDRRLKELVAQEDAAKKQLDQRKTQVAETSAKLIAERAKSLAMAKNLQRLQEEVFRAQIEGADAGRRNVLYERRIRALEIARRGGKQ
jgi:chromosome segregation ATPase